MKRSRIKPSRKPIAHRSKRMQAKYDGPDGRKALVARLLEKYPVCQFGNRQWVYDPRGPGGWIGVAAPKCQGRSVDCHEILSRARGGSILDDSNILCVCRACHTWITDHPAEATKLGLLKSRWGKHEEYKK